MNITAQQELFPATLPLRTMICKYIISRNKPTQEHAFSAIRFKPLFPFLCMILLFTACSSNPSDASPDIPEDVESFLEEYLEVRREGTDKAVEYVYFPEEYANHYELYKNSGDILLEYSISESKKVNDGLYAFRIRFASEGAPVEEAYNFVAVIDGEYRIIINRRSVPEELRENFTEDDYYVSPPEGYEFVDEEDVIGMVGP